MKRKARKGLRLHIGLFGRRNVGKSSLLNALTRQETSIVSPLAGTTTDPVEKPMELQPLGPVLFIDTAGIDDEGALGEQRIARTRQVLDRVDLGLIVCDRPVWGAFEEKLASELRLRGRPVIAVFSKSDQNRVHDMELERLGSMGCAVVSTSVGGDAATGTLGNLGMTGLRAAILDRAPADWLERPSLLGDLVPPGEMAVLVVPVDKEAPTGRLILPQQQAIRELLDGDSWCLVVKERELGAALDRMQQPPALVVTDSQVFLKVAADTPPTVPMTSFSVLFARQQGDLAEFVRGAMAIDKLRSGSRVLIAEACSHHATGDDIGRVKIPRWLRQYAGSRLEIEHVQGHDFPDDLAGYDLIVHCGACMWNRREVLNRVLHCRRAGVPITNYGLTIAWSLGIFERALAPFPAALEVYHSVVAQESVA